MVPPQVFSECWSVGKPYKKRCNLKLLKHLAKQYKNCTFFELLLQHHVLWKGGEKRRIFYELEWGNVTATSPSETRCLFTLCRFDGRLKFNWINSRQRMFQTLPTLDSRPTERRPRSFSTKFQFGISNGEYTTMDAAI